jgi:hypothetical protein
MVQCRHKLIYDKKWELGQARNAFEVPSTTENPTLLSKRTNTQSPYLPFSCQPMSNQGYKAMVGQQDPCFCGMDHCMP